VTTKAAAKVEAILTALRAKSPRTPGELAKTLKLKRATLNYQLKPLLKSGAVLATGTTADRQFSLPPRSRAAKEAP
jgi:DNA-binding transcriptional ArsR family regulator